MMDEETKKRIAQAIALNMNELKNLLPKVQAVGTNFATETFKSCAQYAGLARKEYEAGNFEKAQEFIVKATENLKTLRKRTD